MLAIRRVSLSMLISVSLQIQAVDFPILALIAHDILAVPAVSISVERLFLSSKHTLSDSRSAMTAESTSKMVIAKEWLKKGLGVGVNYLDDVRILI
jgi:hypothetical protein